MDHRQSSSDTINKIVKQPSRPSKVRPTSSQATCKFCGGQDQFLKSKCPAYEKVCSKCGGRNHFAKVCKKTQKKPHKAAPKVRNVETNSDSESSSDWVNSIKGTIKCNMLVKGKPVAFLIDSGASVNLLPIKYATHLVASSTKPLRAYCDTTVDTKGISRQVIKNPKTGKNYSVEFVVVDNECQPVIGLKAARQMKLLAIKENNFEQVASLTNSAIFNGELGSLPGKQHLTVDSSVAPVIMPDRRVPIAMKAKLKTELGDMVKRDITTPVEEPTPWVSQLVVTPKPNGRLRVCLDPKYLNKALQQEHYTMPILDDILHDLSSSKVFTKADLQNGYWHVQLDEESSRLTFQTCFGRFRFLRLPFGLNVSAEIFERKIGELFGDMPGVVCMRDVY
ncbi:transposon Ty3-I Gag-Pol polyprotein [Elysia marginata]|uniref:Transposon Ty3-I Gag-Pol polyprotein n=1 Tax=Elysia marginata TaxID=1093978 RepID=A0AAV4G7S4_9GAST|nr:transposon Ty3-I Gag-Pol polyprotein [Elysia marginata]